MRAGVTVLFLFLVFGFVLPKLADYRAVADHIGDVDPIQWLLLGVFAGWFLVAYVFVFMSTMPGLRFQEGFVVQTTATAINNSLPAGGAIALPVTYTQFLSWGFTPEAITAGLLTAGVWDQLARLALPVIGVAAIAITGDALWWMWLVSLGGIVVVAGAIWLISLVLRSESAAVTLGNWLDGIVNWGLRRIKRDPIDVVAATLTFRDNVRHVARYRWKWVTAATVANHASMAALFIVSLRAVGVTSEQVSLPWLLLAFSLGRLLVMIPVSPGGLGLVDLGFIGLVSLGWGTGADPDLISAGVLLYRALSFLPPILIGLGSWVFWRVNRSWRRDWKIERRGEVAPT
ncbi:MAG: YbhN family protein [Actinomycetota bacterium]|nr:YbhN family protein [Actinomycetota bacterium]